MKSHRETQNESEHRMNCVVEFQGPPANSVLCASHFSQWWAPAPGFQKGFGFFKEDDCFSGIACLSSVTLGVGPEAKIGAFVLILLKERWRGHLSRPSDAESSV